MPLSTSLYFSPVLLAEIYRCSVAVKHPGGAISWIDHLLRNTIVFEQRLTRFRA